MPEAGVPHRRRIGPPVLAPPSTSWSIAAAELLHAIRSRLSDLPGSDRFAYDHIGSTSVPGLAAKPIVDLQIRMPSLPPPSELEPLLAPIGFRVATGARPDSPGVYRDIPRGSEHLADEVWEKRAFVSAAVPAHLHIRRSDSPWGRYTVWFRDWLTAHPEHRERYQVVKKRLAVEHAADPDHDDYTRAKTDFFDEIQPTLEAWARERGQSPG